MACWAKHSKLGRILHLELVADPDKSQHKRSESSETLRWDKNNVNRICNKNATKMKGNETTNRQLEWSEDSLGIKLILFVECFPHSSHKKRSGNPGWYLRVLTTTPGSASDVHLYSLLTTCSSAPHCSSPDTILFILPLPLSSHHKSNFLSKFTFVCWPIITIWILNRYKSWHHWISD